MKIIFLLPSLRVNGATLIFEMADRLESLGHDVHITSLDEPNRPGIYPLRVQTQKLQDTLNDFQDADAIVALNAVCAFYLNDLETKARKYYLLFNEENKFYPEELFKIKYPKLDEDRIAIERDSQKKYLESSYSLKMRYIVANDDLRIMLEQFALHKADVVRIGINEKLFYPDVSIPKGSKIRIVLEGNNLPWKGLKTVNRALSDLRNFDLWTFGDSPAPIKCDKHWKNPTTDDIRKILSSADIFIRAYDEDGTAELTAQAMACGCAVLTTETSGSKMFCTKKNSVIIKLGDYEQMAKELKILIKDKKKRETLVRNGLETAKSLSWDESIKVLESVLKGRRSYASSSSGRRSKAK